MSNESLTLYKLIILFILDKIDFAMTNAQISDFILEKEYTNYFNIQQAISELVDSELIECETIRNSTHYKITHSGQETLEYFNTKISDAIKKDIDEYLNNNKYTLREEVATLSDYFQSKKDEYMVRCQVKEKGSSIIDLSIAVPTEEEAVLICNSWKDKSQDVYAYLIRTLMNPDK
jgi:DNA-binding PadR family transcriptional regulator